MATSSTKECFWGVETFISGSRASGDLGKRLFADRIATSGCTSSATPVRAKQTGPDRTDEGGGRPPLVLTLDMESDLRIGVLAVQGNFREHLRVLARLGVEGMAVRKPEQLEGLDGLIVPEASPPRSRD